MGAQFNEAPAAFLAVRSRGFSPPFRSNRKGRDVIMTHSESTPYTSMHAALEMQKRAEAAEAVIRGLEARLRKVIGEREAYQGRAVRAELAVLGLLEDVRALIPAECYVLRATELTCTSCIGGTFPNGSMWTEDMCCLPCRLRAVTAAPADAPASGIAALLEHHGHPVPDRITVDGRQVTPDPATALRETRARRGLSYREAATELHATASVLHRIETGGGDPSWSIGLRIIAWASTEGETNG